MVQEEGTSPVPTTPSPLHHFSLMPISASATPYPSFLLGELSSADRGLLLIHLLVNCATHVAARNLEAANSFLEHISLLASPEGDAIQRMASYFTDALACRLLRSLPGLYRALHSTRPSLPSDLLLVRRHFFDLCPFLKLSILAANKAIVDAMQGERMVHVIDLHACDPSQWVALLHMLSSRPEGPPHLRITGVHQLKDVLDHVGMRLSEEAERLDVPFQFNPVVSTLENLDLDRLRVKTGEALAVNSLLQLHRLLAVGDADGDVAKRKGTPESQLGHHPTPVDGFLAALRGLSPKLVVVAEQESNHNGAALGERFTEALNYYAALFDCLETAAPRGSTERAKVERSLLGEEIRNVIACEGVERKERHERLERWARRMDIAGFASVALSYEGLYQARLLLQGSSRCDGYKVTEENGCFLLCWHNHPLFSLSTWRCRRLDTPQSNPPDVLLGHRLRS